MAPRAVLFDLDGTIWDSYPWYASAINSDAPAEIISLLRAGNSIVGLLRRHRVSERALLKSRTELRLFPTVRETLDQLRDANVAIAAVTNLPGRLAVEMLGLVGLQSHLRTVIHAGNCRPLKPHPRPILLAISQLGLRSGRDVFFVGDTLTDATAASQAAVTFGWAAYGYGTECPRSAEFVLHRLSDVLRL